MLGYKGEVIKEYFLNYPFNASDFTLKQKSNEKTLSDFSPEDWTISFVDTGQDTMTGGRIKRAEKIIGDEDFMLTYGDGVSDIDLNELKNFHKAHNKIATMTCIQPEERGLALSKAKTILLLLFKKNQVKLILG